MVKPSRTGKGAWMIATKNSFSTEKKAMATMLPQFMSSEEEDSRGMLRNFDESRISCTKNTIRPDYKSKVLKNASLKQEYSLDYEIFM